MVRARKYGEGPLRVAVVHGGPGAVGEMAHVARDLAKTRGVLEPLQTASTVTGQAEELHAALKTYCDVPALLVGHSWGAWLSVIVAARYPPAVRKIILVGAGPFREEFASDIARTRLSRLSEIERAELKMLERTMSSAGEANNAAAFSRFGALMAKADSFDPIPAEDYAESRPDIFESVWREAAHLRASGDLLRSAGRVLCPVVVIHGQDDPHPVRGVVGPLKEVVRDFRSFVLPKCGHVPWLERHARERFFEILIQESD